MKFTANRQQLLDAVKTVLKVVTPNKDIPEISGVLIETDAATGILSLTGTDIRTQIQRRLREGHIEESGSVILMLIFAQMLQLLDGELVDFQADGQTVIISSGNAVYKVPYLNAKSFPRIKAPFPENTICIRNITSLIQRTLFVTENEPVGSKSPNSKHIKITFSGSSSVSEASSGNCIAITNSPNCADGSLELILHEKALRILNTLIKPSEELYVGTADNFAVFMKEDLFFSTMMFNGNYMNVSDLLSNIAPVYKAITDATKLYELVSSLSVLFSPNDDRCINLNISENKIKAMSVTTKASSKGEISASNTEPTSEDGFNYQPKLLLNCLKRLSGQVCIKLDKRGFMLLETNQSTYFVCPRGPVRLKAVKPKSEKKSKTKKTKKLAKQAA